MLRIAILFILFIFHLSTSAELLPVEAFGKLPEVRQVKLSPNGKKIAFIRVIIGTTLIGITDLEKGDTKYVIKTNNEKFKIDWHVWANNDLLLVSADYPVSTMRVKYTESRLLKINVSGDHSAENVVTPRRSERRPQFQNNIVDMLPNEPNAILMALDFKDANSPDVYKMDLNSKKHTLVYRAKRNINDWLTDRQHRVRLGYGRDDTKIFFRLLDLQTNEWRNIWEYEIFDVPDVYPLGFGLNPNQLYVRANHKGRYAIFKVDLTKKNLPRELVFADANYDVEGSLIYSKKSNDVIGVYHGEASDAKEFFEASHEKFQKDLNKTIPNAYNNISSMSDDERKYILYSSNTETPGAYYLGDRDENSLSFLLEQYPLLYNQKLSGKNKIIYQARDGIDIEGYLTLPNGDGSVNNAAVIIPHGGPMSRNYSGFDWFSEFFASRGYMILEPNFRGSSGYGFEFEMESIQKWGGAMQDDLEDAAHWLIKNHSIDKHKICILGASYGGYAAMMAAVKQQKTFSCAASFAGVSDLEAIVKKARKFTNYKVVKKQIGNDSDKRKQNSPINFAESINIPLMLIHGNKDRVVDVSHSRKMYQQLLENNKEVEYIELENGNHHLGIEANRLKTLASFERFLKENINAKRIAE